MDKWKESILDVYYAVEYRLKMIYFRLRYPKKGRNERFLKALGYTEQQIDELVSDHAHLNMTREDICGDEIYYLIGSKF